jgi:hypothetical protein
LVPIYSAGIVAARHLVVHKGIDISWKQFLDATVAGDRLEVIKVATIILLCFSMGL